MKLTDLPKKLDMSVYEDTRNTVIDIYKQVPGVLEVLEFGTIPLPGISDMDFHIVIEPHTEVTIPTLKKFSDMQRYAMEHGHFAVSKNCVEHLRLFDPWLMHIDPLLHENSPYTIDAVPQISDDERKALSIDHIFAGWIFENLHNIATISVTQEVECRAFLEAIKGTEYCYRELAKVGVTDQVIDPNTPTFTALRKEWFDLTDAQKQEKIEEAFSLWKQSTKAIIELLTKTIPKNTTQMSVVKNNHPLLKKYPQSLIIESNDTVLVYQKDATQVEITASTWDSPLTSRSYQRNVVRLPLEISATQNLFLKQKGPISSFYTNHLYTDLDSIPILEHAALQKRIAAMNQNVAETFNAQGGKQPIFTYEAAVNPAKFYKGNLRAQLGGRYDRTLAKAHNSLLGQLIPKKTVEIPF